MENEILKTIQELQLNKKAKVNFQKVTFVVKNKNNKLTINPESSLTFDLVYYAVSILLCYFLISIGFLELAIGLVVILYISNFLNSFTKYFAGLDIGVHDLIYKLIVKKTTEEFTNKYGNIKFIESN